MKKYVEKNRKKEKRKNEAGKKIIRVFPPRSRDQYVVAIFEGIFVVHDESL